MGLSCAMHTLLYFEIFLRNVLLGPINAAVDYLSVAPVEDIQP